jgi:hypothetical protein
MAARGEGFIAVKTASVTPAGGQATDCKGLDGFEPEEFIVRQRGQTPRDGNSLPSKDDYAVVTSFNYHLYAVAVEGLLMGVATGAICALSITGSVEGGAHTTVTYTATNMIAGPIQRFRLPGKAAEDRLVFQRSFTPTAESVFTGPVLS